MNKTQIFKDIVTYIKKNRISSTEVADCLGKTGNIENSNAVNRGHFAVGPIKWVYAYDDSNWSIHEQMIDIDEGDVIFIEAFNCGDRATIGGLVAKYAILYKGAAAIVSNANFRDANDMIKNNYPVWCKGFNPVGCFNKKQERELDWELVEEKTKMYSGAIAVCDDTGVVIIPPENVNDDMLVKLQHIENQEDIWFDCLDRYKWNTYEIVCLKKYLKED